MCARSAVVAVVAAVVAAFASFAGAARADTLPDVLVKVYQNNPQLNAQRAQLRVTDENVPQALSGYRPNISVGLNAGYMALRNYLPPGSVDAGGNPISSQSALLWPWMIGITATQPLFNGFKTANSVRQAEFQVRAGREALRGMEQTLFVSAVSAYMNVVADQALIEAQQANVTFLRETSASTRRSRDAGQVTDTDVAQSEARLNRGLADLNAAEVTLAGDQATYRQIIGAWPGRLATAEPADRLLPKSRDEAVAIGRREHPAVAGASYDVDAATSAIKVAESALYPSVNVQGTISRSHQTDTTLGTTGTDQAAVTGNATVPIYDGGLAPSQIRQAKEALSQSRLVLDQVRLQIETAVITAWAANEGAKTAIRAGEAEVRAATIALAGVRRERDAGQRTTLDVLNSQQDLVAARGRLISAQRDRVIASYSLAAALGRLDHRKLGLNTPEYEPEVHYQQVRDAWHGLRTPAGQ
jgi:outer membrane protein